jgi:hypothetical protein
MCARWEIPVVVEADRHRVSGNASSSRLVEKHCSKISVYDAQDFLIPERMSSAVMKSDRE